MAKCGFCTNPRGVLLNYKNCKRKLICENCYYSMRYRKDVVGICFECKKKKVGVPERRDLNHKQICEPCYDKILNNPLNFQLCWACKEIKYGVSKRIKFGEMMCQPCYYAFMTPILF